MTAFIDVALVVCVLLTVVSGAKNGFFREIFALAGLAAGLYIGLRLSTPILDRAPSVLRHSGVAWTFLFGLLFVATYTLTSLIGHALASAWEGKDTPGISRFFGLFLGGVRGYLLALFLGGILVTIAPAGNSTLARSRVLPHLGGGIRWGASAVLPPPSRDRLLRRWEALPFRGRPRGIPAQSGEPA